MFARNVFRLGCDPEKLFPFHALRDQWKKFGIIGTALAAMMIPMLTTTQEDMPDINEMAKEKVTQYWKNPLENPECMKRMRGVIEDVIRLGFV